MHLFNKILIANRGEIAVRIIRSAKKIGIKTVAVYSTADEDSLHVRMADEAYCIGDYNLKDSYLNIDKIINAAKNSNSQAIHPGYGFLSENAEFAARCKAEKIVFIGPDPETIARMGNKIEARKYAKSIGIPLTEGVTGTHQELINSSENMEYPLLVKAAAGGGGKGMRIVRSHDELVSAIESTSREAKAYFGDESIYVEKYIENPRHIEIQIIGDNYGNVVHLFERECSIQRRYQKIIEESPSPTVTDELRQKMGNAAVKIGKEIGYKNAGTIEFLVDNKLNFYFLEVNTRVQVEHPVTEMVTGIDIVEEQIIIAAGGKLRFTQDQVKQTGHAIECRIYAEDPENNFLPYPGNMNLYHEPSGSNIRVDSGIDRATTVESFFDPMISKMIVCASNREIAIKKSIESLRDYVIHGIKTNIPFLIHLLEHQMYAENNISTHFCDNYSKSIIADINHERNSINSHLPVIFALIYDMNKQNSTGSDSIWKRVGFWREIMEIPITFEENKYKVEIKSVKLNNYLLNISGVDYQVVVKNLNDHKIELIINKYHSAAYASITSEGKIDISINGNIFSITRDDILDNNKIHNSDGEFGGSDKIVSPMPGKIIKINRKEGDKIKKGDIIMIIEAMKMENNIVAPFDLEIIKFNVALNDMIDSSKKLIDFEEITENIEKLNTET